MKRVLLATSALCLGAGTAMAQDMGVTPTVTLSGNAEMGVAGSKDDDARFHTDMDITFKASGETDAGVKFSATIDIDEVTADKATGTGVADAKLIDQATNDDEDDGGVTISISQPETFGTLTMGDTAGAIAWAVADARGAQPGSIRDNHEHGGSSGNDGLDATHDNQILLWNRDIGSGFSMAASVEIDDDADGKTGTPTYDPILGIGGKYEMGMGVGKLGLGAGFQMGSKMHTMAAYKAPGATTTPAALWEGEVDATAFGASVTLDFTSGGDGIKVIADGGVMEADGETVVEGRVTDNADVEKMHLGIGLGYTVGAISLGINAGSVVEESTDNPAGNDNNHMLETTKSGVGFSAAYDLGGGAALQFGVGTHETEHDWTVEGNTTASGSGTGGYDSSSDTNSWSLGIKFAF
ncbi:MAG: porin [Rhodobacter sp.]|nr:porin [Rhodobacter sp.]